jgi:flagellar hook protein FlgE
MSALQSGVSGMLAHQLRMDVIGDNIANASTVGFKSSRALFTDALYQATSETWVGSGVQVAATQSNHLQGPLQASGRTTDIAIEGEGFLTVTDGATIYYTRSGALGLDASGNLIHLASGMKVAALPPDSPASAATTLTPANTVQIPMGATATARATTAMSLGGNLDSRSAAGGTAQITARVYDTLGNGHDVALTFTRSATPGQWDVTGTSADGTVTIPPPAQVTFDANGKPSAATLQFQLALANPNGATGTVQVDVAMANTTQLAQESSMAFRTQDGMPPGVLSGLTIAPDGSIQGVFSNGLTSSLGQLVLGTFTNTSGLEKFKDTLYQATPNSGLPSHGAPGSSGRGLIRSGQLESSNVNLAQEFADMILTQRGYQASARVVNTADQMLQELMNITQ